MIKFIPHHLPLPQRITVGHAKELVHNKANTSIALQLSKKFKGKHCPAHPNFENTFVVDLDKKENFLELQSHCCSEFKEKLDLISRNKNPF